MRIVHFFQTACISLAIILVAFVIGHSVFRLQTAPVSEANASIFSSADALLSDTDEISTKVQRVDESALPSLVSPPDDSQKDNAVQMILGVIKPGDTFKKSLTRANVPTEMHQDLINRLQKVIDFRRLQPGDTFSAQLDKDGSLLSFLYESSPFEIYELKKVQQGYSVEKLSIPLEIHTVRMAASIDSSLFDAYMQKEKDPKLLYAFADIFGSKIDFNTEVRRGDRFVIVYDKYFKDNQFVGFGQIRAAVYEQSNGRVMEAYYYETEDGQSAYFDQEGKEVGTSFLRSPVPMGRVTSRFTYRRKHPVTGVVKPHLGIDLAAPVGTPIMASADGKVISIGRNGGNGNQIILSHFGGYKTYYGHLSRFKKGLRRGSYVSKKEIIGYVGSSGLSTGPHLDYRISLNGSFKNPFSLKFKPKSELSGQELARYQQSISDQKNQYLADSSATEGAIQIKSTILEPGQRISLL